VSAKWKKEKGFFSIFRFAEWKKLYPKKRKPIWAALNRI
jgi:hypothetical protein